MKIRIIKMKRIMRMIIIIIINGGIDDDDDQNGKNYGDDKIKYDDNKN